MVDKSPRQVEDHTEVAVNPALNELLNEDFDFKGLPLAGSTHRLHAFAAKFPPQLPARFIERLTSTGDTVLDPMMGSGTTLVEASSLGRRAIGFDLDPLAAKQCRAKTTPIKDMMLLERLSASVVHLTREIIGGPQVDEWLSAAFDGPTRKFVNYWFLDATQREIAALLISIATVTKDIEHQPTRSAIREFMEVALSAIIVTKSGGVSLARDLAHGRARIAPGKTPRNGIRQFELRIKQNTKSLLEYQSGVVATVMASVADARDLTEVAEDASVDLVVTSPPYANAIDYMRAHKFALVWFGWPIETLTERRAAYIGSERTRGWQTSRDFPKSVEKALGSLEVVSPRNALVVAKYMEDMRSVLQETRRILKPASYAIMVVGPSTIRGVTIDTASLLADIATTIDNPLRLAGSTHRTLDRDRRLLPASVRSDPNSVIQRRIHRETVLCLEKCP